MLFTILHHKIIQTLSQEKIIERLPNEELEHAVMYWYLNLELIAGILTFVIDVSHLHVLDVTCVQFPCVIFCHEVKAQYWKSLLWNDLAFYKHHI